MPQGRYRDLERHFAGLGRFMTPLLIPTCLRNANNFLNERIIKPRV
jgi:hypothetical protein